jgi:hypothetical protein
MGARLISHTYNANLRNAGIEGAPTYRRNARAARGRYNLAMAPGD